MARKKVFTEPKVATGFSLHAEVYRRVRAMADESQNPLSYYFERAVTHRYAPDLWELVKHTPPSKYTKKEAA